jgi:hypothetical protein
MSTIIKLMIQDNDTRGASLFYMIVIIITF